MINIGLLKGVFMDQEVKTKIEKLESTIEDLEDTVNLIHSKLLDQEEILDDLLKVSAEFEVYLNKDKYDEMNIKNLEKQARTYLFLSKIAKIQKNKNWIHYVKLGKECCIEALKLK